MLHMIGHIIFGLIVGVVAKLLIPGTQRGGLIMTCILGMLGAWLGGYIGRALGWYPPGHPAGFFMAVVGAIVVILIYEWVANRASRAELRTQPPPVIQALFVHAPGPAPGLG